LTHIDRASPTPNVIQAHYLERARQLWPHTAQDRGWILWPAAGRNGQPLMTAFSIDEFRLDPCSRPGLFAMQS